MDANQMETLAKIRHLIGYLGEKDNFAWWQSSFFTAGSEAFLLPLFARTQCLAQSCGVTGAAALVHDERIGTGHVYHLFRLPEDLEQGIHHALHDTRLCEGIATLVSSKEAAFDFLHKNAILPDEDNVGPTRVGSTEYLNDSASWRTAIGYYLHAFEQGIEIYPYFSDIE
jgi:hypothetical protein